MQSNGALTSLSVPALATVGLYVTHLDFDVVLLVLRGVRFDCFFCCSACDRVLVSGFHRLLLVATIANYLVLSNIQSHGFA